LYSYFGIRTLAESARLESLFPGKEFFVFEAKRVHPPSNPQGSGDSDATVATDDAQEN
jgi:hypothetical protein